MVIEVMYTTGAIGIINKVLEIKRKEYSVIKVKCKLHLQRLPEQVVTQSILLKEDQMSHFLHR